MQVDCVLFPHPVLSFFFLILEGTEWRCWSRLPPPPPQVQVSICLGVTFLTSSRRHTFHWLKRTLVRRPHVWRLWLPSVRKLSWFEGLGHGRTVGRVYLSMSGGAALGQGLRTKQEKHILMAYSAHSRVMTELKLLYLFLVGIVSVLFYCSVTGTMFSSSVYPFSVFTEGIIHETILCRNTLYEWE